MDNAKISSFSSKKNSIAIAAMTALIVTIATIGIFLKVYDSPSQIVKVERVEGIPASRAVYTLDENGNSIPLDFTKVADHVMDAVVHIKSIQNITNREDVSYRMQPAPSPFGDLFGGDPFDDFFGPKYFYRKQGPQKNNYPESRVGQGSGVIISDNGYIITNNHVIDNSDELEVTLHDNRSYKATIVGTDPTTDLALLQIKETQLPTLPLVDSDDVRIGEWVMAVGNPFNLTSTVTAGIVSAKGRNINILKDKFAVESFIQTDAAINPGNSGGALVNLEGGLIGINTAIASPTGAYSGYGFAVPTNIVGKVIEDLMKYGVVQRGVLGVMIRTLDGKLKEEMKLSINSGVYVDSLVAESAAAESGIKVGDVITSVNGLKVDSSPELQEMIARHRPGDKVKITVDRNGREKVFDVTLNNRKGNTNFENSEYKDMLNILGANMETISSELAKELEVKGGVIIKDLFPGKLRRSTDMREGFIITKVDGRQIKDLQTLMRILEKKKGGVMVEGVYEDIPGEFYYAFGL